MGDFDFALIEQKYRHNYVGIHFCKEGRIEREIGNEFLYLMPDDCLIILENKREIINTNKYIQLEIPFDEW